MGPARQLGAGDPPARLHPAERPPRTRPALAPTPSSPRFDLADALAKAVGAGIDDNPNPVAVAAAMVELGLTSAEYDEIRILVEQRLSEVELCFE